MRQAWLSLRAIFIKDIMVELRAKSVLPTMVVLGLLIVFILGVVSEPSAGDGAAGIMGSAALWIAFLFSGLLAQERSFTAEQQNACMDALLLAPVDAGTIYLAKLSANVVMLAVFEVVVAPAVLLAFSLDLAGKGLHLAGVLFLGNLGISSVGTLFSAAVQVSRTRGALLSIVVLALLMPMMVPASFALLVLFGALPDHVSGSGALAFVGSFKAAVGFMVAFDAVFVVACWLLFGLVVQE